MGSMYVLAQDWWDFFNLMSPPTYPPSRMVRIPYYTDKEYLSQLGRGHRYLCVHYQEL